MPLQPKPLYSFDDYLVEVLSPFTEGYDRGGKCAIYRNLDGLCQYVLVARDRFAVDVFTRQSGGRWLLDSYVGADEVLELDSISCKVTLRDIYAKVSFDLSASPGFR